MTKPNFEIPTQVREIAEKSVDQARKAFDGLVQAAQKAAGTVEGSTSTLTASAKDVNAKVLSYAEANIGANFDFAANLAKAKDFNEIIKLQTDFVQAQLAKYTEQAKELGAVAQKVVADAASQLKA